MIKEHILWCGNCKNGYYSCMHYWLNLQNNSWLQIEGFRMYYTLLLCAIWVKLIVINNYMLSFIRKCKTPGNERYSNLGGNKKKFFPKLTFLMTVISARFCDNIEWKYWNDDNKLEKIIHDNKKWRFIVYKWWKYPITVSVIFVVDDVDKRSVT